MSSMLPDRATELEAAHVRQANVDEGKVEVEASAEFECVEAGGRKMTVVPHPLEELANGRDSLNVLVHEQDAHSRDRGGLTAT